MIFEYKVRAKHKLGYKEFIFYADTDIEEFLNRNDIKYVRNITDTIEHKQKQEIEELKAEIKELNDDNVWWTNRFNAVERDNERLNSIIKEAIEYLESYNTDFKNCRFGEAPISLRELGDLLDILKGSDK